ncbi:MAG: hypothetical protein A2X94_08410 [Bdellovibrionales bacterium GWB1_55_8]|nr:MAG: hypothetical protein A2X94_08410 [Bdellovibrionales bacterium GWB1_55_8]
MLYEHKSSLRPRAGAVSNTAALQALVRSLSLQIRSGNELWAYQQVNAAIDQFMTPFKPRSVLGSPFIRSDMLSRTRYDRFFPELLVEAGPRNEPGKYYGSPAACHSVYQVLFGSEISEPVLFDVTGICSRNEREVSAESGRLRHFSMRELVVLGPEQYCESMKKQVYDAQLQFCKEVLDIDFKVVVASDPFCGADATLQKAAQIMEERKLEFVIDLPGVGELAFSSLNTHGSLFTDGFEMHSSRHKLVSFCLAWGIDRIALILASQGRLREPAQHD